MHMILDSHLYFPPLAWLWLEHIRVGVSHQGFRSRDVKGFPTWILGDKREELSVGKKSLFLQIWGSDKKSSLWETGWLSPEFLALCVCGGGRINIHAHTHERSKIICFEFEFTFAFGRPHKIYKNPLKNGKCFSSIIFTFCHWFGNSEGMNICICLFLKPLASFGATTC